MQKRKSNYYIPNMQSQRSRLNANKFISSYLIFRSTKVEVINAIKCPLSCIFHIKKYLIAIMKCLYDDGFMDYKVH